MAQGSPKHFYKVDMRTFSLSEILYYLPGINGFLTWLLNVLGIKPLPVYESLVPFPVRADSFFCDYTEVSLTGREMIAPFVESFERLGFSVLGYEQNPSIDPNVLDCAACHLLHQNGKFFSNVIFLNSVEASEPHRVSLTIWCLDSENRAFGLHNKARSYDIFAANLLKTTSILIHTDSPFELFREFELRVNAQLDFSSLKPLYNRHQYAQLIETRSVAVLEEGLRRGRFIPMTEIEVQELKRKHSWRYAQT